MTLACSFATGTLSRPRARYIRLIVIDLRAGIAIDPRSARRTFEAKDCVNVGCFF